MLPGLAQRVGKKPLLENPKEFTSTGVLLCPAFFPALFFRLRHRELPHNDQKEHLYSFERSTYEDKQLAKDRTFGHRSRPVNLLRQHGSASASCLVPDVARMDCSG